MINNWLRYYAKHHPLILELCANNGDRALQAYANLSLSLQLTDRDPEALYHLPKRVGGIELDCFNLCVEEPWGRVDPATRLVVCRNGLHMMRAEQMLSMFGNVVDLGAMLILVNCMDPDEPITIDFHRDIQRIGYQVWPRSTVLGLAAHAGLQLMQITTFTDDESCGQYGPVTAMTLLPTESPSVSQGGGRFGWKTIGS